MYVATQEARNFGRALRSLLGIAEAETLSACLARVRQLLDDEAAKRDLDGEYAMGAARAAPSVAALAAKRRGQPAPADVVAVSAPARRRRGVSTWRARDARPGPPPDPAGPPLPCSAARRRTSGGARRRTSASTQATWRSLR